MQIYTGTLQGLYHPSPVPWHHHLGLVFHGKYFWQCHYKVSASNHLIHPFLANVVICIRSGKRHTGRFKHVHKHIHPLKCLSSLLFTQLKKNETIAWDTKRQDSKSISSSAVSIHNSHFFFEKLKKRNNWAETSCPTYAAKQCLFLQCNPPTYPHWKHPGQRNTRLGFSGFLIDPLLFRAESNLIQCNSSGFKTNFKILDFTAWLITI